jgi:hypothetical protein
MGFFQNIKNKLGIGGVSVVLHAPGQVSKEAGTLSGKIVLTTKSEQVINTIVVKIIEEYTTGRGDDKKTKEFTLGETQLGGNFTIKPGETKEIEYTLGFELVKSSNDELKEKGGALGTLGSLAKMANKEQSAYFVNAEVDVKSAVLDPSDKKEIKLV